MIYLLGDSHSTELFRHWKDHSPNVTWKTLLGFGLQAIVKNSPNRNMPEHVHNLMSEVLGSLEKDSIILMSYLDPDGRIGMGDQVNRQKLAQDYESCLNFLFEKTSAKKIHFLDWYGVKNKVTYEQTCSQERRLANRKMQLEVLSELASKFPIEVHSTSGNLNLETESGFLDDSAAIMIDDCHYNFGSEIIKKELFPIYESLISAIC